MKKGRFTIILLCGILSLVLLTVIETRWSVNSYRSMRDNYTHQLQVLLEEATWQYVARPTQYEPYMKYGSINRLHTFVGEQLRSAGIDTEYMVEVCSTTNAEPIVLMAMGDEIDSKRKMVIEKQLTPIILRLTVNDPHNDILSSMRNILLLQIISILLLVATFYYLTNTLFKAKAIERIRQDLTHNITHELKTPITAAYVATDVLRTTEQIAQNKSLRDEYLDMTLNELKRLSNMVDEILHSSIEAIDAKCLTFEECNIREIFDEVCATQRLKYRDRDIVWQIEVESDTIVVADRHHLYTLVSTLVDNGIKYCSQRPIITLGAHNSEATTTITVQDNGVGIAKNEQRLIFEKFYRIPQGNLHNSKGYGLGLYYAKNIVKSHNGSIELSSKIGQGSIFRITLPRYGTKTNTNS